MNDLKGRAEYRLNVCRDLTDDTQKDCSIIREQIKAITQLEAELSEANRLADLYLRIDIDHQKQLTASRSDASNLRESLVKIKNWERRSASLGDGQIHVFIKAEVKKALSETEIEIPIQVMGKVRAKLHVSPDTDPQTLETLALSNISIQKFIEGKIVRKVVVVPGRLVNILATKTDSKGK